MNKRLRLLFSAVALFSVLAFACFAWTKQAESIVLDRTPTAQTHQFYCAGPSGNSSYLAEVKSRVAAVGSAVGVVAMHVLHVANDDRTFVEAQYVSNADSARPLWLIHRALLI